MRPRLGWWVVVVVACGSRTVLESELPADASADDAAAPSPPVDASAPLDSSRSCSDGDYYITVNGDAGTLVLEGGCGEAGVPTAEWTGCGHKNVCPTVFACGAASIQMSKFGTLGTSASLIRYSEADGSTAFFPGMMTLDDWPDAGGIVSGSYTTDAGLGGTFCVKRR